MYKAQVTDTMDLAEEGKFRVYCEAIEEGFIEVIYVSPYYTNAQGGFIAIPERGAEVLITQIANDVGKWYYMGSVVSTKRGLEDPEDKELHKEIHENVMPTEGIYNSRNIPQKVLWKTPMGHIFQMSDQYNPKFNNNKIELRSSLGKKILMADSEDIGMIWLRNELGDGIMITSENCRHFPGQSFISKAKGYQIFVSKEAELKLRVVDGQDLHIENTSTGMNSLPGGRTQTGNININSKYRDINITCKEGRTFIDSGDSIQLECVDGNIIIHSAGKISIESEDSIHMKALKDIRLESVAGNVDIKAGINASVESAKITSVIGGTIVGIDAPLIGALDSQKISITTTKLSIPAGSSDPDTPEENNYGN